MDDPDSTDTQLWRYVFEQLVAGGASRGEAFEGANLLVAAHMRRRRPPPESARAMPADEPADGE